MSASVKMLEKKNESRAHSAMLERFWTTLVYSMASMMITEKVQSSP